MPIHWIYHNDQQTQNDSNMSWRKMSKIFSNHSSSYLQISVNELTPQIHVFQPDREDIDRGFTIRTKYVERSACQFLSKYFRLQVGKFKEWQGGEEVPILYDFTSPPAPFRISLTGEGSWGKKWFKHKLSELDPDLTIKIDRIRSLKLWHKNYVQVAFLNAARGNRHRTKIIRKSRLNKTPMIVIYDGGDHPRRHEINALNMFKAMDLGRNTMLFSYSSKGLSFDQILVLRFLFRFWSDSDRQLWGNLGQLPFIPAYVFDSDQNHLEQATELIKV